jgi:hypothetical protein
MKRLLILLFILMNLSALGQTYTAERIVATRGFYLKDRWVDSIGVDTTMSGEIRSLPSSDAVHRMVAGRLAALQAALQISLADSTSVLRDSINALRADMGSGSGATTTTALTDVSDAVPTNNATLVYNQDSLKYVPTQVATYSFSGLTTGDLLKYNGSVWVNFAPAYALNQSLEDSISVLRDSINALRSDIGSGGGGTTIARQTTAPTDGSTIYFNTSTHKLGIQNDEGTQWLYFTPSDSTAIAAGGSYDTDAQAYITAVEAAGRTLTTTEEEGIDDFVVGLKADGLWTKARQLGLLTHGSFAASKINMKSPGTKDLTSSNGTVTYAATGATGSTGYINTGIAPYTEFPDLNTMSMAVYVRTTGSTSTTFDVGSGEASSQVVLAAWGSSRGVISSSPQVNATTDSRGLLIASRTSDALLTLYKDGTSLGTNTTNIAGALPTTKSIYLCAYNDNGTAALHSPRELSFWWFGEALSSTEAANLNTRFQALKTAIGF